MAVDFRIVDFNYAFDVASSVYATSENVEFPASNMTRFSRSKPWRSSGYFEVRSTNQKLDFKDASAGPELTATLTVGNYTPTSLASEIKTQMEAVGAQVYTVSFSATTGKWTITTDGSDLELLASSGSNSGTSIFSSIGFTGSDFVGNVSYTSPKIALHTVERLIVDLRTEEEIDSVALLFDPTVGTKLSENATVTLKGSATSSFEGAGVYSQALSFDQEEQVFSLYLDTAQEFRYWCIEISDAENAYTYVELHTIFIGKKISLTRGPEIGFVFGENNQSSIQRTSYGHAYFDTYPDRRSIQFLLNTFEDSDLNQLDKTFRRTGNAAPILVSLDSDGDLVSKDKFTIYGVLTGSLGFTNLVRDRFSAQLFLDEVF